MLTTADGAADFVKVTVKLDYDYGFVPLTPEQKAAIAEAAAKAKAYAESPEGVQKEKERREQMERVKAESTAHSRSSRRRAAGKKRVPLIQPNDGHGSKPLTKVASTATELACTEMLAARRRDDQSSGEQSISLRIEWRVPGALLATMFFDLAASLIRNLLRC